MRDETKIQLIGVPLEAGASTPGTAMGPAALRTAGLAGALAELGHEVEDLGDLEPEQIAPAEAASLAATFGPAGTAVAGWVRALSRSSHRALEGGALPLFLGGDHSLSMGTLDGVARHCREAGRELFVLWLDAHADFNTPRTSPSGNLHGMSLAMLCGEEGFDGLLENRPGPAALDAGNLCLFGARSIDPGEREVLLARSCQVVDMRRVDERGVEPLLRDWLAGVAERDGVVHVSLDLDFLDPELAPGVGTPVAGGASYREAHLVMEMLHDSGRVISIDAVELNPFLDVRGQSARLMTELLTSLFGRQILYRLPGRSQVA